MNPFAAPLWGHALLLCIPGALWLGHAFALRATRHHRLSLWLSPVTAGAMWLLLTHVLGRLTRSFYAGAAASAVLCAVAGSVLAWRRHRARTPSPSWRELLGEHVPWMLASGLVTAAIFGLIAFNYNFHDENGMVGHLSTVTQLIAGRYPPVFLGFPYIEFIYHYAFNVLAAGVALLLRLDASKAIDVLTVLSWLQCWCLLWEVGTLVTRDRRAGPLSSSLLLIGGGFSTGCPSYFESKVSLGHHLLSLCSEGGMFLNPAVHSYFFQHPWAAGIPVFLALWAVLSQRQVTRLSDRVPAYALFGAALILSQMSLAVLALPALVIAEASWPVQGRVRRAALLGALFAVVLLVMSRLGGFFAAEEHASTFEVHPWVVTSGGAGEAFLWHARTFGLVLPLALLGLVVGRQRLFPLMVAGAGVLIINTLRYRLSWDIVKFSTVAQISAALLAAQGAAWLLARRGQWGPVLGVTALVGAFTPGMLFVGALLIVPQNAADPLPALPRTHMSANAEEKRAAAWVVSRVRPGCVAWAPEGREVAFAHDTPMPQVHVGLAEAFPIKRQRIESRGHLLNQTPAEIEPYLAEGVQFVLVANVGNEAMRKRAQAWQAAGQASSHREGAIEIFELPAARCGHR